MKSRTFLVAILTLLITGCSSLQNLTVEDVRQERFLAVTKTYDLTLQQIQQNLYTYDTKCSPVGTMIRIDPSNKMSGLMVANSMGFTDVSVVAVVDFKQVGDKTVVKGYKYTTPLISQLDTMMWAIDNPNTCYSVRPKYQ